MNDEHNALNEFARPDSRAIPPPGHALLGEGHLCSNHWSVLIHPSVWDGYYFVTVWSSHEKDEGSTMDYLKRTIRADYLEFALDQLCPGWQAFEWSQRGLTEETPKWEHNLFDLDHNRT